MTIEELESYFLNYPSVNIIEREYHDNYGINILYDHFLSKNTNNNILVCENENKYNSSTKKIIKSNIRADEVLKILNSIKNKTVFIDIPFNLWEYDEPCTIMSKHNIIRMISECCNDNNVCLILSNVKYKHQTHDLFMLISSLYVRCYNNNLKIIKNRYGVRTEYKFNIDKLFINIIREKKLKKILE